MKLPIIIFFILGYLPSTCQKDSVWQVDLVFNHVKGVIPETGTNFLNQDFTSIIKKKKSTFVPGFTRKTIHGIIGYQYGLDYFQKFANGYIQTGIHFSKNPIYPAIISTIDIHRDIFKKLSFGLGIQYANYHFGDDQYLIKIGPTFYYKNWMGIYNTIVSPHAPFFHKILLRKNLRNPEEFVQVFFFHGVSLDQIQNREYINTVSNSIVFSLHKNIFKKMQLRISLGTVFANSEKFQNQYFNYSIGLKKRF